MGFPIIDNIKSFLVAAALIAAAVFAALFKYRGERIDSLEDEVANHEAKDKAQDFEANNREAAAKAEAQDERDITSGTYTI